MTLETVKVGVSLSVPPTPEPLSTIVPTPKVSNIVAFVGVVKLTLNVSAPSYTGFATSLLMLIVTVCVVTPGANVSMPEAASKSLPITAVTELVL